MSPMVARALAFGLMLAVVSPGWALAAEEMPRQVALLIGNSIYIHAGTLASPGNDVAVVGQALQAIGFSVRIERDLTADATKAALRRFRRAVANADAAVIYFAGHGFLRGGKSYVPAIDARFISPADLATVDTLDAFTDAVLGAKTLRLVITDIAQDDPLTGTTTAASPAHRPDPGTIVLLSASPGQAARDRQSRVSPFAEALAQQLAVPRQDVWTLAQQVREDVLARTKGRQEPRLYGMNLKSLRVFLDGR